MKQQKWGVPCLRGKVGEWIYYSALMKAEQLRDHVVTSKHIRESDKLDDFLQRTLRQRYEKIAEYLLQREDRFFNSIIIGVFDGLPDWVQFDLSPMAEKLGMPEIEDAEESMGLMLFFGSEKMFAIDGQHRIEGIKAAFEKNPERIGEDEYSVIFIAHNDDKAGKIRTRRLFSDINNNAVRISGGDKVIIDEDDLAAIVTRRIYAEYPAFDDGKKIAVTEKKEQLTQDGQERFSNLLALYTVCQKLKPLFKRPRGTLPNAPANVEQFQDIVVGFLDFIIAHEPSLHRYFKEDESSPKIEREKNKNLFFRPIGLELLARLYAYAYRDENLDELATALAEWKFDNPGGVWDGILWKSGRIDASEKARNAATQLCLYFMGLRKTEEDAELLNLLREVRNNRDYALPDKFAAPKK